jgi:hypothetical protein
MLHTPCGWKALGRYQALSIACAMLAVYRVNRTRDAGLRDWLIDLLQLLCLVLVSKETMSKTRVQDVTISLPPQPLLAEAGGVWLGRRMLQCC